MSSILAPVLEPERVPSEPRKSETYSEVPLFTRHPANPILSRKDWPYPINSVFNAAAVRLDDGDTLLLCRVEDRRGLSHLMRRSFRQWSGRLAH